MNKLKNYQILQEHEIKELNAKGTLLKHEKSGAHILVLENDDENKVFSIAFKTTPKDSTGVPHIIEHSVLCGSTKYPVKEPFVELLKGSLNTFLNAMTYPDKTVYPVASCNDADFANLMDIYMDAVCNPNIYKKEEIFKQEGWHYELNNPDDELTINGVVYNEMKGAFSSPDSVLYREILHVLYPDTTYGVESGGIPEVIPNLTYEEFLEFHHFYYHPSNSYIFLYGNMDAVERLNWLDEAYLSKYDAIKVDSEIKVQTPFKEIVKAEKEYPVSKESSLENKTYLSYNVSIDFASNSKLWLTMEVLQNVLLNANGAPLKQALLNAGIGDDINGGYDSEMLQPYFSIIAKNANIEQTDDFIKVIEETLKNVVKEGINKQALQSTINYYEFKYRQADFGNTPKGIEYCVDSLCSWLYDVNNPFARFETDSLFAFLKEQLTTDYFEETIKTYFLNNPHKALVCIKPSHTLAENKELALKEKLATYKASLTKEEIDAIIEDTKALKLYQSTPDTKEALATIPTLKRSDIAPVGQKIICEEKDLNGTKVLFHDVFTNGIGYLRLLFDIKNIPSDLVPYLGLFVSMLGQVDTKNYSYQQLEEEIKLNSGGVAFDITPTATKEKTLCHLTIKANVLFDKIDFAYQIIDEIIHTSMFNDHKRLKEIIAQNASYMQRKMAGAGHVVSLTRALSYIKEGYYYNDLIGGVAYNDLLMDLLQDFDNKADELEAKLNKLLEIVFSKKQLLISYTSTLEAYQKMIPFAKAFIDSLKEIEITKEPFVFAKEIKNEGFETPFDVQYVAMVGNFFDLGYKYQGSLSVLVNIINMDYLWPEVRVKGGAYGCFAGFNRDGNCYFVSYRDPNLEKTLDVYKATGEYISKIELNEEDIFKYVIGTIGEIDKPLTPRQKGAEGINAYLMGITDEENYQIRQQVINCHLEDLHELKALMEAIIKQEIICAIGNENKIKNSKNIFKNIRILSR